jgi:dephospho-CoA kinase
VIRYPALAVTGGVGCGKSEVGRILERIGVAVLDSDAVAHRLLRESPEVREAVVRLCGSGVRGADGELDRAAIAARVFADDAMRKELEAILHPRVREAIETWRATWRARGACAALIPLLFEAGFDTGWDAIWCVAARDDVAAARLAARGWTPEQIEARRKAQWPTAEKAARADATIENNGSLEELESLVKRLWRSLEKRSR